ncbi:MAG: hypothetical protein A3E81_00175 [Gammaproteobacteria bacterium RIFCSPHIGHO2_12_FULL_36_30]|nr:MAG: hypothetical protein A3E81_00175 [Gammaproteobacteria bacterium RIFCSPHIGHO2_12_FULL_36_30]
MNETLLEMATALHSIGKIDEKMVRKYQTLTAPKIKVLRSSEIKRIRSNAKVTQVVFAKLLNISPETVRKWEQGDRHPTGASLKLLNLVFAHGLQALY